MIKVVGVSEHFALESLCAAMDVGTKIIDGGREERHERAMRDQLGDRIHAVPANLGRCRPTTRPTAAAIAPRR